MGDNTVCSFWMSSSKLTVPGLAAVTLSFEGHRMSAVDRMKELEVLKMMHDAYAINEPVIILSTDIHLG